MPSIYAHLRFGDAAKPALPREVQLLARNFPRLFELGLQGPDLFFYYNPFFPNKLSPLGRQLHQQSGQTFFDEAVARVRKAPSDAVKAYLFGVLGHYCLDSCCHPYVHEAEAAGEARHTEMESDFDRFLMRRDRIENPARHSLVRHLQLTKGECTAVAGFYGDVAPSAIRQCVRHMCWVNRLATTRHRKTAKVVLSLGGKVGTDMLIPQRANSRCRKTNPALLERYQQGLERYPALAVQLSHALETGEPLGMDFTAAFG